MKTFSEFLGPADEESAIETYKTCKGLKPVYVLLLCTQEAMSQNQPYFLTMSQNQPYFLIKYESLYVGDCVWRRRVCCYRGLWNLVLKW